jgi:hypothetical protein
MGNANAMPSARSNPRESLTVQGDLQGPSYLQPALSVHPTTTFWFSSRHQRRVSAVDVPSHHLLAS